MPYISRFVQVFPATTPNVGVIIPHGLDNSDVSSVEIFSDDPSISNIPFTWSVIDSKNIRVTSSMNLEGCWVVVRAL